MPEQRGGRGGGRGGRGGAKDFKFDFGGGNEAKGSAFGSEAMQSAFLPIIQQKMAQMVGQSSGYFESLPKSVQGRVRALKKLQNDKSELDKQYQKELAELQKKFADLAAPLYDRRKEIVIGTIEPSAAEATFVEETEKKEGEGEKKEEGKKEEEVKKEEPKKEEEKKEEKKEETKEEEVKGIPGFWLEAIKHHPDFADMVMPEDEPCLKHLIDVRIHPIPNESTPTPSFVIDFHFSPNEYFEETLLSKTYHLFDDEQFGEVMYDRVDCTPITWKAGKNLTVKLVTKQQKVGGGKGGRGGRGGRGGKDRGGKGGGAQMKTVTVEEPVPSFFNFFQLPDLNPEDEEDADQLQMVIESDYDLGVMFKQQIVPNAVKWFTGEAEVEGMLDDGEDDEEDEEDYNSDEDEDFTPPQPGQQGQQPECKQQ